ncbi:choice-of-anchor D domain-containing protein [Flavobacterium sp.]
MKIKILFFALLVSTFSWGQSVVISQYIETNSGTTPKGIEIFNVTASDIVFSAGNNLQIFQGTNGAACTTAVVNITSGTLQAGKVWVIGTSDLVTYTTTNGTNFSGTTTFTFTFNGDDALRVALAGVTQDMFGLCGSDPGTSWTGGGVNTADNNLQLIDGLCTGDTDGWTDPSTRFTQIANGSTMTGFGDSPASCTTPCVTPTSQASAISSSNVTTTTADLSWTSGVTATGTLIALRQTSTAITAPTSGTNYAANTAWASAGQIDVNNRVVYKNTGTSVTGISGLTPGIQYTATPYAYNGSGTNVCFNTTNPESFNFYTLTTEPASHSSFTSCGASTATSIVVNFAAASTISASGYLIIYRQGATPTGIPTDGTIYGALATIGDSTVGTYVSSNIATSATISNLNGGSSYTFALIPWNASAGPIAATVNYRTSATIPTLTCSTSPAPEINVRGIVGSNPTITDGDTTPSGLDNTLYGTFVVGSPSPTKTFRIENTGNANLTISALSMVGGNSGDFTFPAITFPLTIAGGAFYDLVVTFTPGAAGTRSTTLTITSNDVNEGTYDFLIQGTGTATSIVEINVKGNGQSIPDNSIYPQGTNWTYFPVTLQGGSSTRVFTIENLGSTNLSLTGASPYIQITGAHASLFTVTVIPSNSIAGGGTTTFEITFSPTSGGSKNATIIIANNDTDEAIYNFNISGTCQGANNIYVSGNGYDVPKFSSTTSTTNLTSFGLVPVTTGIKQNTFVITNLAGADRYLSNVSVSGGDAPMFTVVAQPNNGAFGTGNTTSFTINFTPSSAGVKTTTVSFNVFTNSARTTPDALDPVFSFTISGEGIVYTPCSNNAVQTILVQDFDVVPATPTWGYSPIATDGSVSIAGGTFNNGSGAVNAFVTGRSLQFRGIGTGTTRSAVFTMNAVDVSQYNNINFSMRVGAFRASGTTQGLDVNDLIQVETSVDGGVNWSVESVLRGFTNSRWNFATTGVFNAYYTGNNSGVTMDTRNGNAELTGTAGISTYYIKNLPQSSNLLIRITLNVDRDDELWALDDIKIEGQTPQSSTWNGSAWSAGFPTASTKAIFDGDYITTAAVNHGSVEACECQINSGRNVTVDSGYYFEIQSNITNNGNLTIANNGSLIQINDAATNAGNITYQRTASGIRGFDYVYWSSPVLGQAINSIYSTPTPGLIYAWNTLATNINSPLSSGNWQSATGAMSVGRGYIMRGSSFYGMTATNITASFLGAPNNGVLPFTINRAGNTVASSVGPGNGVTVTNYDDNWNLVGNPYPSSIHAINFLSANTDIQGYVYLWTHGTAPISSQNPFYSSFLYNYTSNDYITYNAMGSSSGPGTFNGYIAGGQGFFVMMNDGAAGSGTITFKNNLRSKGYANNQFFRDAENGDEDKHRIWLDLLDANNVPTRTMIGYAGEATLGLDRLYDAVKNTANEFNIYSLAESQTLTIQGRPTPFNQNDIVPIGIRVMHDGTHKIAIGAVDGLFLEPTQPIYLEDKLLNVFHDLRLNPYSFNAVAGIINDRFVLRYDRNALGNPEFGDFDSSVVVSTNNRQMTITSHLEDIQEITVFDVLGRQLSEAKNVNSNRFTASNLSISQQALIVKIKLANGLIVTRKIVL